MSFGNRHHLVRIFAGLLAAFLLTVMCYWPSLDGPFLFDDIPNLEHIGDRGGLDSVDKTMEFITSGQSGPLGRPLSLASFALNGQTWPTDARPFRITNLIIHLVNGLLVFVLARLIFSTTHKLETAEKLALLCVTLWLLHPLLVSTTAYIVQRMTQLCSLFTLAGLICYMHGRNYLPEKPQRAWAWIIAGMGICGALALLSKENGILLPFYALVIELTVFSSTTLSMRHKTSLVALLSVPLVAVLLYMALNWDVRLSFFELRSFTLNERLLTQPVVLMDYLHQVLAPQLSGLGIFHDDFPVSRGLLNPISTVVSLLSIATLLFLAVWSRKKWPFVSLGILWFFAGHSLEAGPIALELYFEHRNYLPLLGPLIAVCSLLSLLSEKLRRLLPLVLILLIGMESFLAWQSAAPWGNEERLMQTALIEHPDSLRAQQYVANQHIIRGQYPEALAMQENLAAQFPEHASTRLSILNLRCILGSLTAEQVNATRELVERSRYDRQLVGFLRPLLANAVESACDALGLNEYQAILDSLLLNPVTANHAVLGGPAHYLKGIAYERAGNLNMAQEQLDLAYAVEPNIDIRLQQVVWALTTGDADAAQRYLTLAQQHRYPRIWQANFRAADLQGLQRLIDQARNSP